MLQLTHWVVVDTQTPPAEKGYQISAAIVVATARVALGLTAAGSALVQGAPGTLIEYPSWMFSPSSQARVRPPSASGGAADRL